MLFSGIYEICILLTALIFVVPAAYKKYVPLVVGLPVIIASSDMAFYVLSKGSTLHQSFNLPFWNGAPVLVMDQLSAFFVLIINIVSLCGFVYAIGYLSYFKKRHPLELSIHLFCFMHMYFSMLMVVTLREGLPFMVAWEIMSISSFVLIFFETHKEKVLQVAAEYFVFMHIGLLFIFTAFILLEKETGVMSFDSLTHYFSTTEADILPVGMFALFFIGFGFKVGFVPFHTWIPHTYSAAPSHVTAILSGAVKKVAIYGILRVLSHFPSELNTLIPGISDLSIIGWSILAISVLTGFLGIVNAMVQNNIKRFLAYSSVENAGIIGIGIGIGAIGTAHHMTNLMVLGYGGALLHSLNHALYKPLLFFMAGVVHRQTKTKNMLALGGLAKAMPITTSLFLIGSIGVCALPPFNGFLSEFLLYNALFKGMMHENMYFTILMLTTIISLVVIGGTALFAYSKTIGLAFLGSGREKEHYRFKDPDWTMLAPSILLVGLMVVISLNPNQTYLGVVSVVNASFLVDNTLFLKEFQQSTIGILQTVSIFLLLIGVLWLAKVLLQRTKTIEYGPTWGCGYTAGSPKHQYTSTSFADNLLQILKPFLGVQKDFPVIDRYEIFPKSRKYRTHRIDVFESPLYLIPIEKLKQLLLKATVLQTGKTQHYLMYAFFFLLLTLLFTYLGIV